MTNLWNPEVQPCIHKSSPGIHILSRINTIPSICLRFILILSSHLHLGHPKGLIPTGVPVKILKALLPSSILATWPVYLNLLDIITLTILGERYKLWSSSLWSLFHSPFSSLLGPNTRLRILFSNTLSLHSSLNIRDHVSQPYSTTDTSEVSFYKALLQGHEEKVPNKVLVLKTRREGESLGLRVEEIPWLLRLLEFIFYIFRFTFTVTTECENGGK